jgi:hypothetical protein
MSDRLDAPNRNRRGTPRQEVKFTVENPETRLSQRAIEAIARLLLAAEDEQPEGEQERVAA